MVNLTPGFVTNPVFRQYIYVLFLGFAIARQRSQEGSGDASDGGALQEVHREGQVSDQDSRPEAEPERRSRSVGSSKTVDRQRCSY